MYTRTVWLKRIGPRNGIRDSPGMAIGSMIGAALYFSASVTSSWLKRNPVRPLAKRLTTTPMTTSSTRYLMVNRASRAPMSTPASTAATRAAAMDWVIEPTRAAANAAVSICPSMATLTTPERSHMTPHRAPRINGVASEIVPSS